MLLLVSKQQALLLSGVCLEFFRIPQSTLTGKAFNNHKREWLQLLAAERRASILFLSAMDQIVDATYQIKQSMEDTLPSFLLPPRYRDSFKICQTSDILVLLNPLHLGSIFP